MAAWTHVVADVLFPRDCAGCDGPLGVGHASWLCTACWRELRTPFTPCIRCGIPVAPPLITCVACARRPPVFDAARALGLYLAGPGKLNPLARAVRALKYRGHRGVAASFGHAMAERLVPPSDGIVVPVPLHRARLRERGYDQAALLARALARRAGLPIALRGLVRRRATVSQAELDAEARRANLRGAFVATVAPGGRPVVLVDDVLTTGATADACARALRAAGAGAVLVLTVGRTP